MKTKLILISLMCLFGYRANAQIYASNFNTITAMTPDDWIWGMDFANMSDRKINYTNFANQIRTNLGSVYTNLLHNDNTWTGNNTNNGSTTFNGPVAFLGGGGDATLYYTGFEGTNQYARSLSSSLLHKQAYHTIPMGLADTGYNYFDPNYTIMMAQSLNTNGLAQHGYNVVVANCGAIYHLRDSNGNLQLGYTNASPVNVSNLVYCLATNGCTFGFHMDLQSTADGPIGECLNQAIIPATAYRDGVTIGSWGVRLVWSGGT